MCSIILIQEIASLSSGVLRTRGLFIYRRYHGTKSIKNFSVLGIVRAKDGAYTYGTNDAYAIAIMFALLLSKSDLKDFISSMRTAFGKLQKQLHTISATDIMSIMGYDANWTNLANLI